MALGLGPYHPEHAAPCTASDDRRLLHSLSEPLGSLSRSIAFHSLFSATSTWRLQVPTVECVNAIGAGDVCTAVFLHSLAAAAQRGSHDGEAAADAFAWGLAAACARCTHQKPSEFTREEVEGMRAKVSIERA